MKKDTYWLLSGRSDQLVSGPQILVEFERMNADRNECRNFLRIQFPAENRGSDFCTEVFPLGTASLGFMISPTVIKRHRHRCNDLRVETMADGEIQRNFNRVK